MNGEMNSTQCEFVLNSIVFCLRHSYFSFLDQFYLQCKGTAMGTNFSPVYANNSFSEHIVFYRRYIDDVLLISSGGPDLFSSFVIHCNTNALGLSFTHVLNPMELGFLDSVLSHDQQNIITCNHTKSTSGNSYLHYDSSHHPTWKNNIPIGQFYRLRRNCTRVEDYNSQGNCMLKFVEKGYPRDLVQDAFLLYTTKSPKNRDNCAKEMENTARCVSTFNTKYRTISKMIHKHCNILKLDQRSAPLLPPKPQISFRKATYHKKQYCPEQVRKTQ